jgi:hypothetical protein
VISRVLTVVTNSLLLCALVAGASSADGGCGAEAGTVAYDIGCWQMNAGSREPTSGDLRSANNKSDAIGSVAEPLNYTFEQVRYSPMCRTGGAGCAEVRSCPGAMPRYGLFTRTVVVTGGSESPGSWTFAGWTCRTDSGVAVSGGPAPLPQVTWQAVLREVQRIGLPSLAVQVQPANKTLVNFATNFYAEPEAFERQVTLLGQDVDVRAEPTSFAWTFGDGATDQTDSPGGAYPDLEITHRYTDADVTVSPSVDVTYAADFRVGDGDWQEIPETVTISGTPVSLRVVEATPVLSGEGLGR